MGHNNFAAARVMPAPRIAHTATSSHAFRCVSYWLLRRSSNVSFRLRLRAPLGQARPSRRKNIKNRCSVLPL